MKVLLVGLPYFSKQLAKDLQSKYPKDTFISLDTYYSKIDKLKFFYHIINSDIVHTINGTLGQSRVLEIALKLKKKIIFHWAGTDIVTALELYKTGKYNPKFISYPTHIAVAPWFEEKLKQMGIGFKLAPLKSFDKKYEEFPFPKEFSVLSYISQNRAQYYGIDLITEIAKKLPEIKFNLVGFESYKEELPPNIKLNGWVENISDWIKNAVVCVRLPKTDGLSFFVVESLSMGRYVAFNNNYKHSDYCVTAEEFIEYIQNKKNQFDNKNLATNKKVALKVLDDFSEDNILGNIYEVYETSLTNFSK